MTVSCLRALGHCQAVSSLMITSGTHFFSRNPHIAQFLKAYKFVKEFGEGVGRMSKEMEKVNMMPPTYKLFGFILKATASAPPST